MTATPLYSDIVLPAATWYEKHDLSSTDMHPFIHPFNPAIDPLWESRSDWDIYKTLSKAVSEMAKDYLPGTFKDVVTTPLGHDSKQELGSEYGIVKDWSKGEVEAIPGKTMPNFAVVDRDYTKIYDLENQTGMELKDISKERASEKISFLNITSQPREVIPTAVFPGSNKMDVDILHLQLI